jgi:chromosome segregation ATPase
MSRTTTKTKPVITTLDDIKQREQIVKISSDDYRTILTNISNLENELEETLRDYNELTDDNEINKVELAISLNEIKNLTEILENMRKTINDKDKEIEVYNQSLSVINANSQELTKNLIDITSNRKTKPSKYKGKTSEEIEAIAKQRFSEYKSNINYYINNK